MAHRIAPLSNPGECLRQDDAVTFMLEAEEFLATQSALYRAVSVKPIRLHFADISDLSYRAAISKPWSSSSSSRRTTSSKSWDSRRWWLKHLPNASASKPVKWQRPAVGCFTPCLYAEALPCSRCSECLGIPCRTQRIGAVSRSPASGQRLVPVSWLALDGRQEDQFGPAAPFPAISATRASTHHHSFAVH